MFALEELTLGSFSMVLGKNSLFLELGITILAFLHEFLDKLAQLKSDFCIPCEMIHKYRL